ncbi:MAG TPA: DUF1684 domain-containing protein [Candidatus Limnocylindrales bacterium]|nr:DUF1684 domain-containing protein [Candidatus Limnocylindrales bacterium]
MTDHDAHRNAVEAWREQRYAALRREIGWLTLAGLDWLRPGVNRIGTLPDGEVVLPSGPMEAGTFTLADGEVRADGTADGLSIEGAPVVDRRLVNDQQGEATLLELGPLRLCVIERGGRMAVRTWDTESTARRDFSGIDHWPVTDRWRLDATFEATGRSLHVPDVLGTVEEEISPGDVVFEVDGVAHRLNALSGGDAGELWLVFGDATNGVETYGGGRFLYTGAPDADGRVVVDFNRAYNPPCVFSPYATCPLPWPANRLPIRVEAGERSWGLH